VRSVPLSEMIRLQTLGSIDLRAADGAQIQSVLRQPKRLAVLIYLAANGPVFHRRDRLLALFWPESDEERARGALAQQTFQLRQALGRDVIVNRGDDEIGLAQGVVWCDANAFCEAIKAGRYSEALELYTGELLPGFLIDDAPDFDRWVEDERDRLRNLAVSACLRLSEEDERTGDLQSALDRARRAVTLQPFSEPGHQRVIQLLDRTGDRAAALRAFEDLRAMLRKELDVEPSAETLELHRTVRERAESRSNGWASVVAGNGEPTIRVGSPHVELKGRRAANRRLIAALAGVVTIAALAWGALTFSKPEPYHPPAHHVAVLYFNDESVDTELGYLADGLTTTLIDELGQVKQLRVISQNGVRPFRGDDVPLDSIARQLDVGTIVGGSVTRSGDRVRVTVELTDGATGILVRSKQLERPVGELFALLDDVSGQVASFLRSALGEEIRLRERQAETESVLAWELYQRADLQRTYADSIQKTGDFVAGQRELARADSLLERAARLDRDWVAPVVLRARVAERRAWMSLVGERPPRHHEWLAKARELTDRAIELDERSSAAYETRAALHFSSWLMGSTNGNRVDSLLRAAERDLSAALALSPDMPRSQSLMSAVLFSEGRYEEARAAARRALDADAYLTDADEIANRLFTSSFEIGDDVEAGHWCDEVRRRQANQWPAAYCDLLLLAWSSTGKPDPRKALLILENASSGDPAPVRESMRPRLTVLAAAVLARAGNADSADAMLQRARSAAPHDVDLLYLEAGVRLLMSDRDRALRLLREYWKVNPSSKARIANSRMFRPLRDDAEFRAAAATVAVKGTR
jgi:DNA-binding SARP family transcriptional activator/TolB-like protein